MILSDDTERLYTRLRRYLNRTDGGGYFFASASDERLLPILNQRLLQDMPTVRLVELQVGQDTLSYQLEKQASEATALIVSNLGYYAYKNKNALTELNFAREKIL
ncbi:MAG: hypothetical protein MUE30_12620, partial [Spirosomaceae bacterium]|nr:hypothetical protein [Spirosomataceae bacterium]